MAPSDIGNGSSLLSSMWTTLWAYYHPEEHTYTSIINVDEEKASPPSSRASADALLPPYDNGMIAITSFRERFINFQCILLNTFSTVAIVFVNKRIFSDSQLRHCQTLVAMWHFFATAVVLYVATRSPFNLFKAVKLPLWHMVPISAFFGGFLLLGNLSLSLNTVGFYQLAKIMTTPTVVLLNFILLRKTISATMLLAIFSVCAGVGLTSATLALSNVIGAFAAVSAFTVTALYQIWIGKKIAELKVSAPQLLLNQAPVSVVILAFFVPLGDKIPDVTRLQSPVLWTLFLSGILASLLNLSQFLIIGRTSALTFNIVSNLKNIIILSLGWYQEGHVPTLQDTFGIFLAVGGAWSYAQMSQK